MRRSRFLFTLLTLLLMALAPAGSAMAASMCAMAQQGETMAMPMSDDENSDDEKGTNDCAFLCAPLCQAVPCATESPGIRLAEPSATFAVPLPFLLLSTTGPEPPPPRIVR